MKQAEDFLNTFLKDGDTILLGCSGGPDSMVLLNLLLKVRKSKDIKLIVAHVNHNVRRESKKEMLFVKDYCLEKDIVFEDMTIEKYSDDNFENEARMIRYNFFDDLANKYNIDCLMTAHHGDDLIETVLMRIVRGSTLKGYSGFGVVSNRGSYDIVRPLVYSTKSEILEYAKKKKIPYAIDKTNFSNTHTRNRYRKTVLPFLKKEDKNVHLKFLKYSRILNSYYEYVDLLINDKFSFVVKDNILDINKYRELDGLLQNEILYKMLEKYYQDDLILIGDVHVNMIKELIESRKANSYIYLPNNIKVIKSYDSLMLSKVTDLIDSYDMEISNYVHLPNNKFIEIIEESDINNNYYCRLSKEDVTFPLRVRTRKDGDKVYIKNMNGSKKLKDIFIDMKIPINERDIWPIVVDAHDNIVWIPGIKKTKYDVPKSKKCDIILRYH